MPDSSVGMDRAADLYDAAIELFLERGYRDVDVADITKRCGVSAGTFYNYFRNKRDLLDVLMSRTHADLRVAFTGSPDATAIATRAGFIAEFEAVVRRVVGYVADNGPVMSFAALTAPGIDDDSFAALHQGYQELGAHSASFLSAAQERGWVRSDIDLHVAGQAVVSCVMTATLPVLLGNQAGFDPERTAVACSAYLLGGLRRVLPDGLPPKS
jgi:AcrR family transcriptional regulator